MHILLPIDGSELSLEAVRFAVQLVRKGLGARMLLVNVQEPASLYEMVLAPDAQARANATQAVGEHVLANAEAILREAGIAHHHAVITGDPAQEIIELVEQHRCNMVIVGASGKGWLRSAIEGSVTLSLVQDAQVPVVVVKPPEKEPD